MMGKVLPYMMILSPLYPEEVCILRKINEKNIITENTVNSG
jgi:hypothetical protein